MCIYTHEKKLTYFGDPLCNLFFIARGVQLDNGVDPPVISMAIWVRARAHAKLLGPCFAEP